MHLKAIKRNVRHEGEAAQGEMGIYLQQELPARRGEDYIAVEIP